MTKTDIALWKDIQRHLAEKLGIELRPDGDPGGATARAVAQGLGLIRTVPEVAAAETTSASAWRKRVITIANGEIGVREEPRNSNRGARVQEYQSATWLEGTGWAWCAAFICWLFQESLSEAPKVVKSRRPMTAGAWDFESWASHTKGVQVIRGNVKAGDIVIFKFSHIGLAVEDELDGKILTVEGNTDDSGSREGGGVYRKQRKRSEIRTVLRITEDFFLPK